MHAVTLCLLALTGVSHDLDDGTLIVLYHSNKIVSRVTDSEVTHVAIAMNEDDRTWIYEATPSKVRRISVQAYVREIAEQNRGRSEPMRMVAFRPKRAYSDAETKAMRRWLKSQVGRRYSVKSYVRNRPSDGVHCAELASSTLSKSGRLTFSHAHAVNPAKLVRLIEPIYQEGVALDVTPQPAKDDGSWCDRFCINWFDWAKWCRWSCYETWTFCR